MKKTSGRNWMESPWPGGRDLALLVLRLVAGSAMTLHGWPKIQKPFDWMPAGSGMPGFLQALAAVAEFGGGIAWMLGLLTPLASFGIACVMVTAIFKVHLAKGDPFVAPGKASWELAALYLAIALVLGLGGAGAYSVDRVIRRGRG